MEWPQSKMDDTILQSEEVSVISRAVSCERARPRDGAEAEEGAPPDRGVSAVLSHTSDRRDLAELLEDGSQDNTCER